MEISELNKLASANIEKIVLEHGKVLDPHNILFNKCVGLDFSMKVTPNMFFNSDEEKEYERAFGIRLRYAEDGYQSFVFGDNDTWHNFKMLSDERIEDICNQLALQFNRMDLMVGSFKSC